MLTLADYPALFFDNGQFNASIIGSSNPEFEETIAVNYVINTLPKYHVPNPKKQDHRDDTMHATEVQKTRRLTGNSILIGTPCNNQLISTLLGIGNCKTFFDKNEGKVALLIVDGNPILIITGGSGEMVYEATKYFHESPARWARTELRVKKELYTYRIRVNGTGIFDVKAPYEYQEIKGTKRASVYFS